MKPIFRWSLLMMAACLLLAQPAMAEETPNAAGTCFVAPSVPIIRGFYPYSYHGLRQQQQGHSNQDWEAMQKTYTAEVDRYMKISEAYDQEIQAYIAKIRVYGLRVPCQVDAEAQIRNPERFTDISQDSDGFVADWFNPFPKRAKEPELGRRMLSADDFEPRKLQPETCTVEAGVPGIQGYYPHQGAYQPEWVKSGYTQAQWEEDRHAYQAEIHRYKALNKQYDHLTRVYLRKVRMYQGTVPCAVEEKIGIKPTPGKTYWTVPEDSDGFISERFNGFPKPQEE